MVNCAGSSEEWWFVAGWGGGGGKGVEGPVNLSVTSDKLALCTRLSVPYITHTDPLYVCTTV